MIVSASSAQADYVDGLDPYGDNYLSLRSGPGSRYREILRMGPDTVVTVLERQGEWKRVQLEDGTIGWAFGSYIRRGFPPGYEPDGGEAPPEDEANAEADQSVGTATEPSEQEPPSTQDKSQDDLERLRLQAEIERLRLEKLKLEQGQSAAGNPQASGEQGGKATVPPGRRVALVIGNSAYASLTPLTTPANDAQALAERLASLGYEVSLGINQTRLEMAELLAKFYAASEGAGVSLFYFSGHGMQIEGRNYLLPVDAAFASQSSFLDVDARAIDLQKFIAASSTARIGVAFVDACRDNPVLEKSIVSSMFKSTGGSMTKGLAVVKRENLNAGQFVGFAAEPGKTAETGTGSISVYTQALLKSLEAKGLDISIMHRHIRGEVEAATNGRQSPRYVDDLADAFALNPGS